MSTHQQLVQAAYRWLLGPGRCGFAFRELVAITSTGEIPDAIGFRERGRSILVECKASRSDFLADRKKRHRATPEAYPPMGRFRFYATPKGLLRIEELPEQWGLLELTPRGSLRMAHNPYNLKGGNIWSGGFEDNNLEAEMALMYSALRRMHLRGRLLEIYESPFQQEAAA